MKRLSRITGLIVSIALHMSAHADPRIDGLKKMNAEGCVGSVKFEAHPPKKAEQVKPYCNCVYEVYFDGFSKAEQGQIASGAPLPAKLQQSLQARLESAQAQCRKKIGF